MDNVFRQDQLWSVSVPQYHSVAFAHTRWDRDRISSKMDEDSANYPIGLAVAVRLHYCYHDCRAHIVVFGRKATIEDQRKHT